MKTVKQGCPKKEEKHFDKIALDTGEVWKHSNSPIQIKRTQRRSKIVKHKLSELNKPYILEIGCGTGAFTKELLKDMPDLNLCATDISSRSVNIARTNLKQHENSVFITLDITERYFYHDRFDAIVCNGVLHHTPLKETLKECYRILKPRGFIYFFEPNMMNPYAYLVVNSKLITKLTGNTNDETAFYRWNLNKELIKAGFEDVSITPFDFTYPLVPKCLTRSVEKLGNLFEKIPVIKEFAGSLKIYAQKPIYPE